MYFLWQLQEVKRLPTGTPAAICYIVPLVIVLANSMITVLLVDGKQVYMSGMSLNDWINSLLWGKSIHCKHHFMNKSRFAVTPMSKSTNTKSFTCTVTKQRSFAMRCFLRVVSRAGFELKFVKCFRPILGLHPKLFYNIQSNDFFFREVDLLCSRRWHLWVKIVIFFLQLNLFANTAAFFCSLLGVMLHSFWEGHRVRKLAGNGIASKKSVALAILGLFQETMA